jgi:hypothetical protein
MLLTRTFATHLPLLVIPAKAGIHFAFVRQKQMGPGFRRDDGVEAA